MSYEDGQRFEVDPRPIDKVRERLIETKRVARALMKTPMTGLDRELTGEEPNRQHPGPNQHEIGLFMCQ
jgi:hypothetical protein